MQPVHHPPVVTTGLSMHVKVTLAYADVEVPTAAAAQAVTSVSGLHACPNIDAHMHRLT